jgi:TatA/E family protein of Tat protein translocase
MGIGNLGITEMAVIFVIALIVFGPRKLPELGRSLGSAMREFRRSINEIQREIEDADPTRGVRDEIRQVRDDTRSILGPGSGPRRDRPPASRERTETGEHARPPLDHQPEASGPPAAEEAAEPGAPKSRDSASD